MKGESCPISGEKVNEQNSQVNALIVLLILILTFFVNKWFIILLVFDFFVKTFFGISKSPICKIANIINNLLKRKPVMIDEAPKHFAAVLGFIFSSLLFVFGIVYPIQVLFNIFYGIFGICVVLEGFFKICMGCIMYTNIQKIKNKF